MTFKVKKDGSVESASVQEGFDTFSIKKDGTLLVKELNEIGLPVRFIRDWSNGSSANTSNHWCQIQALVGTENVAYKKSVTSSSSNIASTELEKVTNGNLNDYLSIGSGLQYIQIDLGKIYNVGAVLVHHFFSDKRTYNDTKTEVSADGKKWVTIFDSAKDGKYAENSSGKMNVVQNLGVAKIGKDGNFYISEYVEV